MKTESFKAGVRSGIPIAMGYFPIAMTFGVLSKTAGVSMGESFLFSAIVYAGASQFMALNMIMIGSSFTQILIATLLLNLRHFLMSASLSQRMKVVDKRLLPIISFGITDEAFSVASARDGDICPLYFIFLHLTAYFSWVLGTWTGFLAGELLPPVLSSSMIVGLYALFVALLVPQLKGNYRISFLVILSGIVNTAIKSTGYIPRGWDIVLTITIVSAVGVLLEEKSDKDKEEDKANEV